MSQVIHRIAVLCAAALCGCSPAAPGSAAEALGAGHGPLVVPTTAGVVRGFIDGTIRSFNGIPYAAPPVGDLRWRPPAPPIRWTGIRDATEFGPRCLQDWGFPEGSEDCLTLNVQAPIDATAASRLPVFVWLHWGGNFGDGQLDASALVARGAVVVGPNHRLGVLGRLAHPLLSAEGGGTSSNYGLMDEAHALSWVRDNIRAFGGDPGNVTLFGSSSGNWDVMAQLQNPAARGLFHRAILETGEFPFARRVDAEFFGLRVAEAAGCPMTGPDPLACLRALDSWALTQVFEQQGDEWLGDPSQVWPLSRVIDGITILEHPIDYLRNHPTVPLLIGHNSHEQYWGLFQDSSLDPTIQGMGTSVTDLENLMDNFGIGVPWLPVDPATTETLVGLYPLQGQTAPHPLTQDRYPTPFMALVAQQSDFSSGCAARLMAQQAADSGTVVHRYLHSHALENAGDALFDNGPYTQNEVFQAAGATHASEVDLFVEYRDFDYAPTAAEHALAAQMDAYLIAFARTGNPDAAATAWPPYDSDSEHAIEIAHTISRVDEYRSPQCDFMTPSLLYQLHEANLVFPWADTEGCLQDVTCLQIWNCMIDAGSGFTQHTLPIPEGAPKPPFAGICTKFNQG